jgi:ribosome recycling factor
MSYDFTQFKKQLSGAEEWLKKEFMQIRTGQASPAILDSVKVEVYGVPMGIKELASIIVEDARTIHITPWEKSQAKDIEKAITVANLGVSVVVYNEGLRVIFPELTADRRKQIAKIAKERLEEGKKQIRGHRDLIVRDLQAKEKAGGYGKDEIFRLKNEAQKIVDESGKKMEEMYARKEKEVLG